MVRMDNSIFQLNKVCTICARGAQMSVNLSVQERTYKVKRSIT